MSTPAQHPYLGYNLYIVHHKKMNRRMANLVNPLNRKDRTTIAYARYLMAVHLGRKLNANETVDHYDENKMNDSLSNLRIMTRLANKAKSQKPKQMIKYICPICNTNFKRRLGQTIINCSKKCGYISASRKLKSNSSIA